MNRLLIYSSEESQYFAKLIAKGLGIETSNIVRDKFSDGELYHRIDMDDRAFLFNKTALVVASTHSDATFDELLKIGSTLASLGTKKRIFIIPFFGYSTMERAVMPGEVVSTKISAQRLSMIPNSGEGNIFLLLDLHVSGIVHYFEGDCLRFELYAEKVLNGAIEELKLENFIVGTADLGRTKWVETFASKFNTEIAFIRKSRHFDSTEVLDVIGDVAGKNVIIYDDMTRSGGTLIKATNAYLQKGANKVYAVLSHLAFSNESIIQKMIDSPIEKIISTNSHPMSEHELVKRSSKFIIKDVSGEFVEIIKRSFNS